MADNATDQDLTSTPVMFRSPAIDSIRALALLGVIVMNVGAMEMRFAADQVMARAGPADFSFMAIDLALLQGKARSAFAFLFGLGFALMMARAVERGRDFTAIYVRRMIGLFAFGLVNQALLFWGDILCLYATLGLLLLLFRNRSDGFVLRLGLLLVLAPPLIIGLAEAMLGHPLPSLVSPDGKLEAARGLAAVTSANYFDFVRFSFSQAVERRLTDTAHMIIYDLGVLGLFLLGLWTARRGIVFDIPRHRSLLRRLAIVCIPVGLALSVISASRLAGFNAEGLLYGLVTAASIGLPLTAFGYLAGLALLFSRGFGWLQALLAPAGRMALTNYLLSGAIGCWFFYGYGLGKLGSLGLAEINLFALLIFAGLLAFSHAWLSRFALGPCEWIWRSLSYGGPWRAKPAMP